jgi:hypothetical protein
LQSLAEAQRNRALLGQAQADLRKSESVLPPSGGTKPSGGSPAGTAEPQPGDADYRLDIGYVALFQHRVDIVRQNQAKPFYKIGRQIWLNGLLRGGGGLDSGFRPGFPAGGGGSAPGGGGMDAGGRGPGSFGGAGQDWVGLGQSFGVGGPMGDAAPGRGGGGAVAAEPTPEKDAATRPLAPGELRRTEFVIIFFWNEPATDRGLVGTMATCRNAPGRRCGYAGRCARRWARTGSPTATSTGRTTGTETWRVRPQD